ncbi:hypothetical protein [Rhabdaerophilum sp. SD176]|uniref:hypothetical protein n=1 Tax=Rhabdaerophilum sp. SD176 TaxID=2983548 RepID=UPI0024DF8BBB|nr:hypothetical protein [Rhabdaerophilum sp. SD176]
MAIELVNGYACRDCGEIAMAKRGIDPQQPSGIEGLGEAARNPGNVVPDDTVSAIADDPRPRATLDYAATLDKLV